MLSWLKTVGQDILKVLGFAAKEAPMVAPIVTAIDPALGPIAAAASTAIETIQSIVVTTEGAFAAAGQGSAGASKKTAAVASAVQALGIPAFLAGLAGRKVINETLWTNGQSELNAAAAQFVQGVVDVMNSLAPDTASAAPAQPAKTATS